MSSDTPAASDRMTASLRVVAAGEPALSFASPLEVLRASTAGEAEAALGRAEAALARGAWIAGYLGYELGRAFLDPGYVHRPLLALGVFGPPRRIELPDVAPVAHAAPVALVDRERYDAAIDALQRAIYDGDVYQANYTVPFALAASGDPFALFSYYARRTGAPYQAYIEDGDRVILSWSPELFLSFEGARIVTRPMKGTAPLDRIDELADEKNRAEHVMIVDLLRNDLHRICDRVEVERLCAIERYPTFATMTSTIAGEARAGTTLLDVLRATFPCGSVTGAPKRAAMSYIAALEGGERGAYCGSAGFLSPQRRGWWNVAIRTAQLDRSTGRGRFDAGGGIVADSNAGHEWEEIALKGRFLRPADFAILETFAAGAGDATIAAHRARMSASARAFGLRVPANAFALERDAPEGSIVRVRLQADGRHACAYEAQERLLEPVPVCLSEARVRSDDPFLRHKTTWRPAHDAAAAHAAARGCFDALLCNERDELTEGWRTNLFVEIGGTLWTPPLASGVLPGVLRARLLAGGRARERALRIADLREASALYVGNSARGLLRARMME